MHSFFQRCMLEANANTNLFLYTALTPSKHKCMNKLKHASGQGDHDNVCTAKLLMHERGHLCFISLVLSLIVTQSPIPGSEAYFNIIQSFR